MKDKDKVTYKEGNMMKMWRKNVMKQQDKEEKDEINEIFRKQNVNEENWNKG